MWLHVFNAICLSFIMSYICLTFPTELQNIQLSKSKCLHHIDFNSSVLSLTHKLVNINELYVN